MPAPSIPPALAALALALASTIATPVRANPPTPAAASNPAGIDWVTIGSGAGRFEIARTETTVAQFRRHVQATRAVTQAERSGGGQVYEAGWTRKPGWTWATPLGRPAADDEPAVHISFTEAQAFCRWAGGRLPTDAEWTSAAYTEQRPAPPAPWVRGRSYPYPTGDSPAGAQCLDDCGPAARERAQHHGARLWRGHGPARAGQTPAGVNGLHEMGANVWEWVDEPRAAAGDRGDAERLTRGGSWWYGEGPMRAGHRQSKPADTAVAYIGWRCVRPG